MLDGDKAIVCCAASIIKWRVTGRNRTFGQAGEDTKSAMFHYSIAVVSIPRCDGVGHPLSSAHLERVGRFYICREPTVLDHQEKLIIRCFDGKTCATIQSTEIGGSEAYLDLFVGFKRDY
jgi:hypothetical protein